MARIRTIKPEFWTSAQVMECGPLARLMFIGMWNFADDHGRMVLSPKTIKAQIFPSDNISADRILGMIDELSTNGLVLRYFVEDKEYLQITGWKHQRIDRPQSSKLPAPTEDSSANARRNIDDGRELKGREVEGKGLPTSSDAVASPDPRTALFAKGLSALVRITGKTPDSARSLIGKWLKTVNDEAIHVLAAIENAERNRVADPVAWINRALKPQERNGHGKRTVHDAAHDLVDRLRALDEPVPSDLRERESGDPVRLLPPGRRQ